MGFLILFSWRVEREALENQQMRIDGWRNSNGPTSLVNHVDRNGDFIIQDMDDVIESAFTETTRWESGRWSDSGHL